MRFRETRRPLLYEINTRAWLFELGRRQGKALTLAEVPDAEVDRLAELGFDLVWLMGVWPTGPRAVEIARRCLPDHPPGEVLGSPYSVAEYSVDGRLGGTGALAALRKRLSRHGLGLVLDFVSNHTGIDHAWVTQRPEFYVQGDEEGLEKEPGSFFRAQTAAGPRVLAHGKDPYFPGWTDTAQLNFQSRPMRTAYLNVLRTIADQCDGIRCDMAMLALEQVFRETWKERALRGLEAPAAGEFWSEALAAARERHPGFLFIAEAYWGKEPRLQELGFDFTYEKDLYDRLVHREGRAVRERLGSAPGDRDRAVRFIENHDEPRAAQAMPRDRHLAAAVVASTLPGMALFHEGQLEGRKIKLPIQVVRRPDEPADPEISSFYRRLLSALKSPPFRRGSWRLLRTRSAWEGNPTWESFLAWDWEARGSAPRLVAVNFGPTAGQCYVDLDRPDLTGRSVELADLLGEARFAREGQELARKGLYLDMPARAFHVFQVNAG